MPQVELGEVIGEGMFGKVVIGVLEQGEHSQPVAIKYPTVIGVADFKKEVQFMATLSQLGGHPHVVGMVAYTVGTEPLLLLELCTLGSLHGLLRREGATSAFPTPIDEMIGYFARPPVCAQYCITVPLASWC